MTIQDIFKAAIKDKGHFKNDYSKDIERAIKKLNMIQIKTNEGNFSVLFFERIDKKANVIEIILSKTAIAHPELVLAHLNP